MSYDPNFLSREGIIEGPDGFRRRYGRTVERIGTPTPLSFEPWEFYRRDGYVYGDHAYVGGHQYYYVGSFSTKDEAVEWAQRHISERSAQYRTEEFRGRTIGHTEMNLNIDGTPPSVIIARGRKYNVLSDDTIDNYQRQQKLLTAWRESVAADDPEIFRKAYWGIGGDILRDVNGVDTSAVPQEVIDTMARIGFTAQTSEDERARFIGDLYAQINEMRREGGAEPIESPVQPLVSGDAYPARIERRPVHVRGHRRRA